MVLTPCAVWSSLQSIPDPFDHLLAPDSLIFFPGFLGGVNHRFLLEGMGTSSTEYRCQDGHVPLPDLVTSGKRLQLERQGCGLSWLRTQTSVDKLELGIMNGASKSRWCSTRWFTDDLLLVGSELDHLDQPSDHPGLSWNPSDQPGLDPEDGETVIDQGFGLVHL